MPLSDSQTHNGERSRETSEVFDSVFRLLMDFANKAEDIVPQPERRDVADDDTTDGVYVDEEEPWENEGDGDAGALFHILLGADKEELVKDVFGKIVANMLDKLPKDGKETETFLVKCFNGLFPKLSSESQREIRTKVEDGISQTLNAQATPSTLELPSASTNRISAGDLRPVMMRAKAPPFIREKELEEEKKKKEKEKEKKKEKQEKKEKEKEQGGRGGGGGGGGSG